MVRKPLFVASPRVGGRHWPIVHLTSCRCRGGASRSSTGGGGSGGRRSSRGGAGGCAGGGGAGCGRPSSGPRLIDEFHLVERQENVMHAHSEETSYTNYKA